MSPRVRAVVVGGGVSCEHEVSLASAAAVARGLDPAAYDVVTLTIDRDGGWLDGDGHRLDLPGAVRTLQASDVVLPILHGPHGEDGELAALCEVAQVPYVGCAPTAGAVGMDKWLTKLVAAAAGVATAPGRILHRGDAARWEGPCVVKPVRSGSSHGVRSVARASEWEEALDQAFTVDDRVLAEDIVHGREIDVAVVDLPGGRRLVGPPLEIVADGVFDLVTKYDGSADFRVPAALDAAQEGALREAAETVFDAVGARGLARVDFFLTDLGPVLIEVNTMPGLGPASQLPRMMAAAGMSYPDLLDNLVQVALGH